MNHLFIATDDLFQYLDFLRPNGRFGVAPFGVTPDLPNLARLEARSTIFRRASAVVPVCGPSRAAIMSGYSPAESGVLSNETPWDTFLGPHRLWTYDLKRAGYYMGTVGKIFHGYEPESQSTYRVLYDNERYVNTSHPGGAWTENGGIDGRGYVGNEDAFFDSMVARHTVQFLSTYDGSKPFHWEVGFRAPHVPWYAPQRIYDAFDTSQIIKPQDWPLSWTLLPFTQEQMRGDFAAGLNVGFDLVTANPSTWTASMTTAWRNSVRNYIVNILWLDEKLGEVLDALEASPFADNTMITLWSDHGYHLGDKGKFHKMDLWEEACNACYMVSMPGQTTRRDVFDPVSLIDIGPTAMDCLGLPVREGLRGESLKLYLDGGSLPVRTIPSFWFGSASAAIGDYRITVYQDGSAEYFNIKADPWLANNLAGKHASYAAAREALLACCFDWGMQLVEEGVSIIAGSPLASYLGYDVDVTSPTTSFVVAGDVEVRAKSPGYQKLWKVSKRGTQNLMRLSEGVEDVEFVNPVGNHTLYANGLNNTVIVSLGFEVDSAITLHLGDGDDVVRQHEGHYDDVVPAFLGNKVRVIAYGGAGNDILRSGIRRGALLYGEEGDDTLYGSQEADTLYGGAGNDVVEGFDGNDLIYAEAGKDTIRGGNGADTITVTGGEHLISGGAGNDTFAIHRTGHVQTITDFAAGDVLSLADWSGIAPATVAQVGADVEVTAAMEKIVCCNTTVAVVKAAITGVGT
ncbi:sulfatase-like hydrolase/transferase [Falsirhodobacter sp. 20TX0035]|uniref:sulfatase-like hydrolase/transferase n=1 Tax=Falsirhodobacter sp. 20TX0035 TaxID=3022019 RepID=UPI00232F23A6|nr:sulfatase-like hydrolase/transferase [Falsirhodobacter sp. 20TX0035]MDB6455037.1 sulfatase-like hydrolase/transferase [Falsirhodobacter sp. 20TX0035]